MAKTCPKMAQFLPRLKFPFLGRFCFVIRLIWGFLGWGVHLWHLLQLLITYFLRIRCIRSVFWVYSVGIPILVQLSSTLWLIWFFLGWRIIFWHSQLLFNIYFIRIQCIQYVFWVYSVGIPILVQLSSTLCRIWFFFGWGVHLWHFLYFSVGIFSVSGVSGCILAVFSWDPNFRLIELYFRLICFLGGNDLIFDIYWYL